MFNITEASTFSSKQILSTISILQPSLPRSSLFCLFPLYLITAFLVYESLRPEKVKFIRSKTQLECLGWLCTIHNQCQLKWLHLYMHCQIQIHGLSWISHPTWEFVMGDERKDGRHPRFPSEAGFSWSWVIQLIPFTKCAVYPRGLNCNDQGCSSHSKFSKMPLLKIEYNVSDLSFKKGSPKANIIVVLLKFCYMYISIFPQGSEFWLSIQQW